MENIVVCTENIDKNNYDTFNEEDDICEQTINCVNDLISIRDNIETMSIFNQIEVLRILVSNNDNNEITLNENKYGVHVNLTDLKTNIIQKLKNFIEYVRTQEQTLNQVEEEKEKYKNLFLKTK
jgi:hypothetical protein